MLAYLWRRGFRVAFTAGNAHLYAARVGSSDEDPLVFCTGIGAGFGLYLVFINTILRQHPHRTVVLLETAYANLQPAAPIVTEEQSLREIDGMVASLGLGRCTWAAHSFGTCVAGWVVKHRPHYVGKLVLIDPVCFRSWDFAKYRTLFHRAPDSVELHVLLLFAARDPALASALSRHLNWFESTLLPEQIAVSTQIFLAERDTFIDVKGVQAYLQHRIFKDKLFHIHLNRMPTSHGFFQFVPESANQIITSL